MRASPVPEIPSFSTIMTAIACGDASSIVGRRKLSGWVSRHLEAFLRRRAGRACASKMPDVRIAPVWRARDLILSCHWGLRCPQSRAFQTAEPEFYEYALDPALLQQLGGR